MIQTPCIIFAGGKSSRMERDKSLLPFASFSTLTEYQYTKLSKIFSHVYISCKDASKYNFQAHFLEESSSIFAPTIGFDTVFNTLDTKKIFVLSVDTPFITKQEIKHLFHEDKEEYDATIALTDNKVQPLCGIYHKTTHPLFKKMIQENNHKLTQLLYQINTHFVSFENTQAFMNLNYPKQYQEALKLSKSML